MSFELIAASLAITLALVFYTIGVFSERRRGTLERHHLVFFWGGLIFDATGTALMSSMATASASSGFGIHAITGMLAIILMLIHAGWATWVYFRGTSHTREVFHRFSALVWLIWLIPYIIGMLVGIPVFHLKNVCAIGTSLVVVALFAFFMFGADFRRFGGKRRR